MKKAISLALVLCMMAALFMGCTAGAYADTEARPTIYRTPEEWKERWKVAEYHPNEEITGEYDENVAVKCTNGTFVGETIENGTVNMWRGIPFAKIPARFERSVMPDASDKVYQALYFGKVGLQQPNQESEPASFYEMGDMDTLTLALATGNDKGTNKPVFVYVHGGAYVCGGTADPAYDLRNLAYYYPDVIFIDITYRLGLQGHINLSVKDKEGNYIFSDYEENEEKFNTANNLAILDVIQSLRWIHENIAGFGGNPDNVTVGGESAGGGLVSTLLMIAADPDNHYIEEEEGLFQKVFSMSGGINQFATLKGMEKLTNSMIEFYEDHKGKKPETIAELQSLTFEDMKQYFAEYDIETGNVMDGVVIPFDPYEVYNRCVKDNFTVLQGSTANDYDYFKKVFEGMYKQYGITHDDCGKAAYWYVTEPTIVMPDLVVTDQFRADLDAYLEELEKEGITDENERLNTLMGDQFLQGINYYMAQKQADNGGTCYCYSFAQPYDGEYAVCKAGHAIDCYYLFGSFNGGKAIGTKEQVDLSRQYQDMVVNFFRYGDPSTKDMKWEPYNKETGYIMQVKAGDTRCIEGFHKGRINQLVKMIDENKAMKIAFAWGPMMEMAHYLRYGKLPDITWGKVNNTNP